MAQLSVKLVNGSEHVVDVGETEDAVQDFQEWQGVFDNDWIYTVDGSYVKRESIVEYRLADSST